MIVTHSLLLDATLKAKDLMKSGLRLIIADNGEIDAASSTSLDELIKDGFGKSKSIKLVNVSTSKIGTMSNV